MENPDPSKHQADIKTKRIAAKNPDIGLFPKRRGAADLCIFFFQCLQVDIAGTTVETKPS